jgi:hypothetical protein
MQEAVCALPVPVVQAIAENAFIIYRKAILFVKQNRSIAGVNSQWRMIQQGVAATRDQPRHF